MKILFLTGWYPHPANPNHGVFIRDQAVALGRTNEILVIAARIDYASFGLLSFRKDEHLYQGIREISITVKRSFPIFNQLNFFIVVLSATLSAAKSFKPDIIHGNVGYPGAFWSRMASKFLNAPYVITEHTKITNNFRSRFHKLLTLFGLKKAAAIVAVSQWHAQEIETVMDKNVTVIGNIIQLQRFNKVSIKPPGKPIHFGMLGGLDTEVKGLDLLLKACALVQEDYVLHIGGTGKHLPAYQTLADTLGIKHKCIFHGFVEYTRVPEFMSQLHFFVSASRSETFGMVIAEAMASGLPVVATNSGGSLELIHSQNGILVPKQDVAALGSAIKNMINQYPDYNSEEIKASVERYSEIAFTVKMQKIYEEALSKISL